MISHVYTTRTAPEWKWISCIVIVIRVTIDNTSKITLHVYLCFIHMTACPYTFMMSTYSEYLWVQRALTAYRSACFVLVICHMLYCGMCRLCRMMGVGRWMLDCMVKPVLDCVIWGNHRTKTEGGCGPAGYISSLNELVRSIRNNRWTSNKGREARWTRNDTRYDQHEAIFMRSVAMRHRRP